MVPHLVDYPSVFRSLWDVQGQILDADLLLFRYTGGSPFSFGIRRAGRSPYSHAAKATRVRFRDGVERLYAIETVQRIGSRLMRLDRYVAEYDGWIDVYRTNPQETRQYDRTGADRWMWDNLLWVPYGRKSISRLFVEHAPLARWFVGPHVIDNAKAAWPPFCSQACVTADRVGGGYDPVPNLQDDYTEPADLSRSDFYRYQFTLTLPEMK